MKSRKMGGQFSGQGVSSADLERGFSNTGDIPEVGENVFDPHSAMMARERKEYAVECCDDAGFEGGFLGRDCEGHY